MADTMLDVYCYDLEDESEGMDVGGHSISSTIARFLSKCERIEQLSIHIQDGLSIIPSYQLL